jgi:hypothetical protein
MRHSSVKPIQTTTQLVFAIADVLLDSRRGGRILKRLDGTRRALGRLVPARRFTLLVDESGQRAVRPPLKGHFVWGGCVVADRDLPWMEGWWRRSQRLFTDDATAEVKAMHMLTKQAPATDKLEDWLLSPVAKALLNHFLSMGALPLVVSVNKRVAGASAYPITASTGTHIPVR